MTQPAKVQEPSMEEILASIRRIIADDEAKPAAAEKPAAPAAPARPEKPAVAAPAAKPPAMNDIPPSADRTGAKPAAAQACAGAAAAAGARAGCEQQPGRHRRDAGGPRCGDRPRPTSGPPQPDARCVRTDRRDGAAGSAASRSFVPQGRTAGRSRICRKRAARAMHRQPAYRAAAVRKPPRRRRSRSCRARPCPRSNPPSTRSPIPC